MIDALHGDGISKEVQRIALSSYYPGHNIRIIGAQGSDVLFELYEYGDTADDHDWLLPILDDIDPEFLNDQGFLNGIIIMEGRLNYVGDEEEPPEMASDWEMRRPTEDEIRELVEGTFTRKD
jgi:hypothetical protein